MADPSTLQIAVVGGVVSVVTAIITAIVTYFLGRGKNKVDIQASLNAGFQTLIGEMQEELAGYRALNKTQSAELSGLQQRVDRLLLIATTFHNFIVQAGMVPPVVDYGQDGMKAPIAPSPFNN